MRRVPQEGACQVEKGVVMMSQHLVSRNLSPSSFAGCAGYRLGKLVTAKVSPHRYVCTPEKDLSPPSVSRSQVKAPGPCTGGREPSVL